MCENKSVIGRDLSSILERTHKSTMSIQCQSAFFQGILHYMRSFCAVIKNFASDQIMDLLLKEEGLEFGVQRQLSQKLGGVSGRVDGFLQQLEIGS